MSYSLWLEVDVGGKESARLDGTEWSYTSNCAPMWREAGADLGTFDGRPSGDCANLVADAVATMEREPERFAAMNPANGWGDSFSLLTELQKLLWVLRQHPKAIVRVHR
jgi:hypothetical protein